MQTIDEQIAHIEEVLRKTPHHKATNGFIGSMRAKIARLKDKQIDLETPLRQGSAGRTAFAVRKQGDATVTLVGPPSSGKSTLINKLTNAESKVAPYEFTTVSVIPGMLQYKNAYIQILDIPGLIEGAKEGKGRGREVLSVARGSDLLVVMTDVGREGLIEKMVTELEGAGIRINKIVPEVKVKKRIGGGIIIRSNIKQDLDKKTIKEVALESGIKNGEITIKEKLTMDRLIDAFSSSRVYIPTIFVINKIDTAKSNYHILIYDNQPIEISAEKGTGLDGLREKIWEELHLVKVYLIKPDDDLNYDNPIIMKTGNTLKDVAEKIGTEFAESKELAKIWGRDARFPGQEVSLSTSVGEGMQIKFI